MSYQILIGNLPMDTSEESLLNWLCDVQKEISVSLQLNDSGTCMGFATVLTRSEEIAQLIMNEYDCTDFGGRIVFMNLDYCQSPPVSVLDKIKQFFGLQKSVNQVQ